jgi:hypothetical protein
MATERDIAGIGRRVDNIEAKVTQVSESIIEHRTRLENGVRVFQDQKDRLETVEKKIEPKPPSVYKIIGITFSVVMAGAGALWALANNLRDRPTVEQIDKVFDGHDQNGHSDMKSDVRAVQVEQGAQRVIMDDVQLEQKSQGYKLDTLIQRTPEPPKPVVRKPPRRRRSP